MVTIHPIYTSVACNRTPEILDWNDDGFVCFGAKNAVVIYDTNARGRDPLKVCSHHKSLVNSVKWLRKPNGSCDELVSASADKTAAVWTFKDGKWRATSSLVGHSDGITSIHGLYNGSLLNVYTGSVDSTVKVWERRDGIAILKLTIPLNNGLCLTLHAHILPSVNQPVLFCALDDHKIHIYAGKDYHRVHTLAGHEDWVRGLDVLNIDNSNIMLASASQDTYIRLWRLQHHIPEHTTEIKVEEKVFNMHGENWAVKLDAVLGGHEGWVYGVQWHPYAVDGDTKTPVYRLLSSSLDKTLIIWEPDSEGGVWAERARLGEVGGGGLGFYGSRFGPKGERLLAHGYNGSFHMWIYNKEIGEWKPGVVVGGHFGSVEDVRWEARGRYLLSAARDQTARLHAQCTVHGGVEWHEISRPQTHGYDLCSLAPLSAAMFASAAEEKVVRVFVAPHNFITNYANITGETILDIPPSKGAEGASVPSLGLSNKAVFGAERDSDDELDGFCGAADLTEPPTEETLAAQCLWPESHKLYGHGYEVGALAAAADGALLASACRATAMDHAAVILWETTTWQQVQKLPSHHLTVTQMEFSPDCLRLLTVSRDRRWTLFCRRDNSNLFDMEACSDKTNGIHTRIIWCCTWSDDSELFATGSRDGKVCIWSRMDITTTTTLRDYALFGKPLETDLSVTAVALATTQYDGCQVVAVGFDSGIIGIYNFDGMWTGMKELDNSVAHHLTVKKLAFQPGPTEEDEAVLASCGADHLVRIYKLKFTPPIIIDG